MSSIIIAGVNDRGEATGFRWFELFGSFPLADDALRRYRARAWANNAWLDARIDFESFGQIKVAIPLVATGGGCVFQVGHAGDVWSNLFGPVDAIGTALEIRGLNDRGRNPTGNSDVELFGEFGTAPLTSTVRCDEDVVSSRVTFQSRGQVNVEFALPASGADCAFELSRADGHRTPRFSRTLGRTPAPMSPALGAYFWGGVVPPEPERHDGLVFGLSRMAQAGFRAARIRMTPELLRPNANVYHADLTSLRAEIGNAGSFLGPAARSSYFRRAFDVAGLQTFVLTAYDAATMGAEGTQNNFFVPEFFDRPENADAVRAEYKDLTLALFETQSGTGKRFIVANWETDNHIYVDGAYGFSTKVRAGLPTTPSSPPPGERVQAFTRWFQLRKEGIEEGKAEARSRGLTGIRVDDAIEFACYRLLQEVGAASTLFDIIPVVKPAVASYSAWESAEGHRLDEDLPAIQRLLGPDTELILGEFGVKMMATDADHAEWRFIESIAAAKRAHVPVITVWEAFTTIDQADGLFDFNGNERRILRRLRSADREVVLDMAGPIAIHGFRDVGDTAGVRHFELYGRFPQPTPTSYTPLVFANEVPINAVVTFQGEGQMNVAIPAVPGWRWCVFVVRRESDGNFSNRYGPRLVVT